MTEFCKAFKASLPLVGQYDEGFYYDPQDDNHLSVYIFGKDEGDTFQYRVVYSPNWIEMGEAFGEGGLDSLYKWYDSKFKKLEPGKEEGDVSEVLDQLKQPTVPYNENCDDCRKLKKLIGPMLKEHIFISTDNSSPFLCPQNFEGCDEGISFSIDLSDTFYFGCADCEKVPWDKVDEVMEIYGIYGWHGMVAWTTLIRTHHPKNPSVRKNEQYNVAYKYLSEKYNKFVVEE